MLHLVANNRAYDPETIAVVTAAYERARQSLSPRINGSDELKRRLAAVILKHVDRGERDPERLADLAFREIAENVRAG